MDEAGFGGFFMHARGGLVTPYLSEEWMTAIRTATLEARTRGLQPWAYDENGWPSGFADGKVNGLGPEYQQKYLRFSLTGTDSLSAVRTEGRLIQEGTTDDGQTWVAWYELNPFYVDTLDSKVAEAFIMATHERYGEFLPGGAGPVLAGFFTDEPQVSRDGLPWSVALIAGWKETWGDELADHIPELFIRSGDWRRTRRRFFTLMTRLHSVNFLRPIRAWLESRGLALTGHQVCEETLESQMTTNGAVMPHYREYSLPGMDWLGRGIDPISTPIQVASVAAQSGTDMVLSETFALCGWHATPMELRWLFEWQMVFGATLLCPHLAAYSLRGIRKRDYPPSVFFQQPWWPEARRFSDRVSRIGRLLADGARTESVLMVHPQAAAWAWWDDAGELAARFSAFMDLSYRLAEAWIGFHYGDPLMLEDDGRVGYGPDGQPRLELGQMSYNALILPPLDDLSPALLNLIQEFLDAGGDIVAMKTPDGMPWTVDGQISQEAVDLARRLKNACRLVATPEAVAQHLIGRAWAWPAGPGAAPVLSASGAARLFAGNPPGETGYGGAETGETGSTVKSGRLVAASRYFEDLAGAPARLLYVVNTDRERELPFDIILPGQLATLELFDPDSGQLNAWPGELVPAGLHTRGQVPAMGSVVLLARPSAGPANAEWRTSGASVVANGAGEVRTPSPIFLDGPWKLLSAESNSLPLDHCDILVDGVLVAEHESVTVVQHRLMELERPADLELRYHFRVDPALFENPDGGISRPWLSLVAETPERFGFELNGRTVFPDGGWYRDPSFRLLDIVEALAPGDNVLVQRCRFSQAPEVYEAYRRSFLFESEKNKFSFDLEIEAPALVGRFALRSEGGDPEILESRALRYRGPFTLIPPPVVLAVPEPVMGGYPFMAGSLLLGMDVELDDDPLALVGRMFRFDHLDAASLRLKVNGKEVASFLWRPFEASLDGYLRPGVNRIEISLAGSLRNYLGPHHLAEGESWFVGPFSFYKEPGLFGRTWDGNALPWNEGYCVVRWGFAGARIE
jgi:hypothetical protein